MLKKMREKRGLSQSQLATASGVSVRTLQYYELHSDSINGAKLKTLLTICDALDCRIGQIVTDPELIEMLEIYEQRFKK